MIPRTNFFSMHCATMRFIKKNDRTTSTDSLSTNFIHETSYTYLFNVFTPESVVSSCSKSRRRVETREAKIGRDDRAPTAILLFQLSGVIGGDATLPSVRAPHLCLNQSVCVCVCVCTVHIVYVTQCTSLRVYGRACIVHRALHVTAR